MIDIIKFEESVKKCKNIRTKKYKKGELITTYIANRTQIGIILEGSADLIRYDIDGNKNIIERFNQGDVYGEIFHIKERTNGLIIEAVTNVVIAHLDYNNITNRCKKDCPIHDYINKELSSIVLDKVRFLNNRIELLTKRSTREKILAYFSYVSKGKINKSFRLPFSYTDLADYLNVDRSAMTREIRSLIEDGFIKKDNRNITILY